MAFFHIRAYTHPKTVSIRGRKPLFFLSERRLKGGVGVFPWEASERQDRMRERESYREIILENIDYDILTQDEKLDRARLDELVELMVDTVCSNREMIRIAGDDYPAEVVKSRFLKIDSSHIEYVLERMRENTTLCPQYQEISAGGAV